MNKAPAVGLLLNAEIVEGEAVLQVGFDEERRFVFKTSLHTTITDYYPGVLGVFVDRLSLGNPDYVGRFCIVCVDEKDNVISVQLSKAKDS